MKKAPMPGGLILTPEERERRSERGRANRLAQLAKNGG